MSLIFWLNQTAWELRGKTTENHTRMQLPSWPLEGRSSQSMSRAGQKKTGSVSSRDLQPLFMTPSSPQEIDSPPPCWCWWVWFSSHNTCEANCAFAPNTEETERVSHVESRKMRWRGSEAAHTPWTDPVNPLRRQSEWWQQLRRPMPCCHDRRVHAAISHL